jgi:hypothetical protein
MRRDENPPFALADDPPLLPYPRYFDPPADKAASLPTYLLYGASFIWQKGNPHSSQTIYDPKAHWKNRDSQKRLKSS